MTETVLTLPRRLAIRLLHEAQIAQPASIRGWVGARAGQPASWHADAAPAEVWARLWSVPTAPAVPTAAELEGGGLHLLISLNTKGVLEMRAWQLENGRPHERVLNVID